MKIRPSFWKITLISILLILAGAIVLFASTFWIFIFQKWDWYQTFIIVFFAVASLVIYFFTLFGYYYVADKKLLAVRKYTKVMIYEYDKIIYVDEKSSKKMFLAFVTNRGDTIYLINDKKRKVYETLIEKCPNLLSKEDLYRRFPKVKI